MRIIAHMYILTYVCVHIQIDIDIAIDVDMESHVWPWMDPLSFIPTMAHMDV